jgi:hypothetical protein
VLTDNTNALSFKALDEEKLTLHAFLAERNFPGLIPPSTSRTASSSSRITKAPPATFDNRQEAVEAAFGKSGQGATFDKQDLSEGTKLNLSIVALTPFP